MKIGDPVHYDAGDGGNSVLALVTKVHDAHTIDLAWMDDNGAWHPLASVPERAEGGGVTWKHVAA
jgi:hypothetical protein